MSKQKLTPWFDHRVKPVHVGWYDTNEPNSSSFEEDTLYRWWWNGTEWGWWTYGLVGSGWVQCHRQNRKWRGLSEKAKQ